jgi:hypothetical protein
MSDSESVSGIPTADEFKRAVKEWVMINDHLSDMKKVISEKNKRKKQLTEYIILFMKENDKEICNLGENGILHMKKQKSQAALNKEHLVKWMTLYFGNDAEKAAEVTKFVFDKKKEESTEKNVLKRSNMVI